MFAAQRSIRYHRHRERFLERLHRSGALVTAVSGSAAFAALLAEFGDAWVTSLVAAAAVAGAIELVFGLSRAARRHSDLARDFVELEQALVRAGEGLSEPELRELQARRLEIEGREPPILRVLDGICHDELVTAHGIPNAERSNVTWLQRWLANVTDIGAHRLRKHA